MIEATIKAVQEAEALHAEAVVLRDGGQDAVVGDAYVARYGVRLFLFA